MAINTASIEKLLRPGLKSVSGDYQTWPSEWSEIFDTYTSDKNFEEEVEMKYTGLAQIRPEGSPSAVDTMGQRIITRYVHKYVSLQIPITRQALMDNLYQNKFPMMFKALKKSMAQTKEILGASVLNNGFSASYPIGDGQPFFSLVHPIDGGTVANTPAVQMDLNESSYESALIGIQLFKDQAGLILATKPTKLIVPAQSQYVAERLQGSSYRINTANNDISATYNLKSVPQGYRVNHYLTNPSAWFILTDSDNGLKHYKREGLELDSYTDFATDNVMVKAVERYSFGVTNFRSAYGSSGS